MNYLGEEGYRRLAAQVMQATEQIRAGINAIDGLHVLGDPPMSLMAIASDHLNIYEVGDEMGARGWHLDRQQFPPTLHLTLNYAHVHQTDAFLRDLAAATAQVRRPSLRKTLDRLLVALARGPPGGSRPGSSANSPAGYLGWWAAAAAACQNVPPPCTA